MFTAHPYHQQLVTETIHTCLHNSSYSYQQRAVQIATHNSPDPPPFYVCKTFGGASLHQAGSSHAAGPARLLISMAQYNEFPMRCAYMRMLKSSTNMLNSPST
mmetsp:Transcript_13532/g.28948  ORF Transcript_13532/g.28948 Transcript_13532/m.28948 type:complete len:103 (-) Transcript_13532:3575-3883(-)